MDNRHPDLPAVGLSAISVAFAGRSALSSAFNEHELSGSELNVRNRIGLFLLSITCSGLAHASCPPRSSADTAVPVALDHMFSALKRDDLAAWNASTSADFVAYEGGVRYDRSSFFRLIEAAHRDGVRFEWGATNTRVESGCDVATMIYVNAGSVTKGGVSTPTRWLETTTFRFVDGEWRGVFTSSMREKSATP